MPGMNVLAINDLSFSYPDGRRALKDIRFDVEAGEKVGLIGPNGAGKSTLLLHLNGILQGSGSISVCGLPLNPENLANIRGMVGMVFQSPDDQLFSPTVWDDVAYGPIYQGLSPEEIRLRVEEGLASVGLAGFDKRIPYHLSIGEKKKVALATVLSMRPEMLVLDEPSAGLDPRSRRNLIELLQTLPQTTLIASHDLGLVRRLTGRTLLINQGIIVADGDTQSILEDDLLLLENGLEPG